MPALIGLAIAIAVTALIALSGRFVTTPAKQAVLPATAPSTDIHARENAERQEAQRRDAGRIAAERAVGEPERERALTSMDRIGVLGLVEHFDVALERLQSVIGGTFPAFKVETVHANRSKPDPEPLDPALEALLREANAVDYAIIDAFRKRNGLRAA